MFDQKYVAQGRVQPPKKCYISPHVRFGPAHPYFYQWNKCSSDFTNDSFLVFIAFLESVPACMEMGLINYISGVNNFNSVWSDNTKNYFVERLAKKQK